MKLKELANDALLRNTLKIKIVVADTCMPEILFVLSRHRSLIMELQKQFDGGVYIITIGRRIDDLAAPMVEDQLLDALDATPLPIILDLGQLEYTSSAGLRAFIRFSSRARTSNRKFCLCDLNGFALDVFETSGLDRILPILPNIDAAKAAMTQTDK